MKILIVEDNTVVVDVLQFLLKDDFEIKIVSNKERAVFNELRGQKFDIILIDFNLKHRLKDIAELIKFVYVGRLNPRMKIVVMSDNKNGGAEKIFLNAGACLVVDKIPLRNVVKAVQNVGATITIRN